MANINKTSKNDNLPQAKAYLDAVWEILSWGGTSRYMHDCSYVAFVQFVKSFIILKIKVVRTFLANNCNDNENLHEKHNGNFNFNLR